jgi:hypothetical protein
MLWTRVNWVLCLVDAVNAGELGPVSGWCCERGWTGSCVWLILWTRVNWVLCLVDTVNAGELGPVSGCCCERGWTGSCVWLMLWPRVNWVLCLVNAVNAGELGVLFLVDAVNAGELGPVSGWCCERGPTGVSVGVVSHVAGRWGVSWSLGDRIPVTVSCREPGETPSDPGSEMAAGPSWDAVVDIQPRSLAGHPRILLHHAGCGTVQSLTWLHATLTSRLPAGNAWLTAKRYKIFPIRDKYRSIKTIKSTYFFFKRCWK